MSGVPIDITREYDLSIHEDMSNGEGKIQHVRLAPNQEIVNLQPHEAVPVANLASADAQHSIVFRRGPIRIRQVDFIDENGRAAAVFKHFGSMTIRVSYECDGPMPTESLGMALAINKPGDLTPVNQFNTHCYRTDDDVVHYHQAPFRTPPAAQGVFEAQINPLQLNEGEYVLSIGLLPNVHNEWLFYEYHHLAYAFKVVNPGQPFGGPFYPLVVWKHEALKPAQAA